MIVLFPTLKPKINFILFPLMQGSKKTMADKLLYNDDTQNYPFCRLKSVIETFKHSTFN